MVGILSPRQGAWIDIDVLISKGLPPSHYIEILSNSNVVTLIMTIIITINRKLQYDFEYEYGSFWKTLYN